jgi:hypothetical protein
MEVLAFYFVNSKTSFCLEYSWGNILNSEGSVGSEEGLCSLELVSSISSCSLHSGTFNISDNFAPNGKMVNG